VKKPPPPGPFPRLTKFEELDVMVAVAHPNDRVTLARVAGLGFDITATALRHPDDPFDPILGRMLAVQRGLRVLAKGIEKESNRVIASMPARRPEPEVRDPEKELLRLENERLGKALEQTDNALLSAWKLARLGDAAQTVWSAHEIAHHVLRAREAGRGERPDGRSQG
jgi:hypothetical protein